MLARANREWVASEISISVMVGRIRWVSVSVVMIQKSPLMFGVAGSWVLIGRPPTAGFSE